MILFNPYLIGVFDKSKCEDSGYRNLPLTIGHFIG